MSYKNWLFDHYSKIFKDSTGTYPNDMEKEFLKKFLNIAEESKGKEIYYMSIYMLKRWYPKFFVFIFISYSIKKYFIKTNAPESLILLNKEFAKYTLNSAIKTYCKVGD